MRYVLIFGAEALFVLLIVFNYRACAKGWFWMTIGTDGIVALLGFTLIRWISQATTTEECTAYIAGAMAGAAGGMHLTRHWKDA